MIRSLRLSVEGRLFNWFLTRRNKSRANRLKTVVTVPTKAMRMRTSSIVSRVCTRRAVIVVIMCVSCCSFNLT
jgi:hypothetical protein